MTTGGVQGVVVYLKGKLGRLGLEINNKKLHMHIGEITQRQKNYRMGGLDAKLEIYQTHSGNKFQEVDLKYKVKNLRKGDNPIFVKVTQKDGHMAWSSPVYLVREI